MLRFSALYLLNLAAFLAPALAASPDSPRLGQDPVMVANAVESFIRNLAGVSPDNIEVSVQAPRVSQLPACDRIQPYLPRHQHLRARMTVGVRCTGAQAWTTFVPATIRRYGYYYVAKQVIRPGDVITHDLLATRRGDLLSLPKDVVLDEAQALGHFAMQRIAAGVPVSRRTLRSPNMIRRGQTVRTQIYGRGFVATSQAQALQNGKPGAEIKIRTSGGKIITGVVLNGHTVHVPM